MKQNRGRRSDDDQGENAPVLLVLVLITAFQSLPKIQ